MTKFYCERCGYSFSPRDRDKLQPPKTCPYCNVAGSIVREKSAQELLTELTDDR